MQAGVRNLFPNVLVARTNMNIVTPFMGSSLTAITVNFSPPATFINGVTVVNDGSWHHVAVNWNTALGGAQALFVDGAPDGTTHASAAWTQVGNIVLQTSGASVSGVISFAEVACWNAQLTSDEILALDKGALPNTVRPGAVTLYLPLWD